MPPQLAGLNPVNGFVVETETFVQQSSAIVSGFNLNSFNLGIEKTFWSGMASAYVTVPFLVATDNITRQCTSLRMSSKPVCGRVASVAASLG